MKPHVKTSLPGKKSNIYLNKLSKVNAGFSGTYPYIHSGKGQGCYFQDLDGNIFLDFASQVASNPLGYNNKQLIQVIKKYSKQQPIKYAGQDFPVKEHADLLEELLKITPKNFNAGFLSNSGAEAVENCLKLALRKQKQAKYGISFEGAFHGRTLGALSCTNSKAIQKKNFFSIPMERLPYNESAIDKLNSMIKHELSSKEIGFIIVECTQGEGGYNVAPVKLIKKLREFTKIHDIPLICDEVQSGLGRTGKWWCYEHYGITPDLMSSAKALQVGASLCNKSLIPEHGSISSTWGGGHLIDLAVGLETIKIIKKKNLLNNINSMGNYLIKGLNQIKNIENIRGRGLMLAFDLKTKNERNNFVIEALKNGLVVLGCGERGVRLIPPYIVSKTEINQALEIIDKSTKNKIIHKGQICNYLDCGEREG